MSRATLTKAATASALALLLLSTAHLAHAEDQPKARAVLGAQPPEALSTVISAGGGMVFALPYFVARATTGAGLGTSLQVELEALAVAGLSGTVRGSWGVAGQSVAFGLNAYTTRATLTAINGVAGVEFQNLALGNDWLAGAEALLTFLRPGDAHVTTLVGASYTIGGLRYVDFDVSEFQYDPGVRNIYFGVIGEWELTESVNLFVELEGLLPLHTELVPIGLLPTASAGLAWTIW